MPDFDSGHIFLTTLAPIKDSSIAKGQHASFTQKVRIALAKLPTAMQSPATEASGENSPFARNRRNHLARMFVLNDVVYNGRVGENALLAALTGNVPDKPQEVDRLKTSYLVFCADIDAVSEDGAPLPATLTPNQQRKVRASYARTLWETMEDELRSVYRNCEGFDDVQSADDFADYLSRCHVETTMPFHDYYVDMPAFNRLPLKGLLAAVAIPAIVALLALIARIFGVITIPGFEWNTLATFIVAAGLAALAAVLSVKFALRNGEKPLPPGKYDDLPSVLKALYLQQNFADFVVDAQGRDPAALHSSFGVFLDTHKPRDTDAPTQAPGVIGVRT